jgi:hypothetical protein
LLQTWKIEGSNLCTRSSIPVLIKLNLIGIKKSTKKTAFCTFFTKRNHAARIFLHWYVTKQVEEENDNAITEKPSH